MSKLRNILISTVTAAVLASCSSEPQPFFDMRGVILSVEDLESVDWPGLAHENGINTIGTHVTPNQVAEFMKSEKGIAFGEACRKYGIDVEHQLHAIRDLLPRDMFAEDSTVFRMDKTGRRNPDWNCCPSSEKALEIISGNAAKFAQLLPATNHRYYFWLDDGKPVCSCPSCKEYSASDQALIIENAMLKAIRKVDPEAQLAHLAYLNTLPAPEKIRPEEGIFLEFASFFYRTWDRPISDLKAGGREMTHADILAHLEDNLNVFPAETAVILEYWLDVSLFSDWKKPAVELPWRKDVFEADLKTYAGYGIHDVTTFAVYMDSEYFSEYPDITCLREYGQGFIDYDETPSDEAVIIDGTYAVQGFNAPWDGLTDDTEFRLSADGSRISFRYSVIDSTLTIADDFTHERTVDNEDRVEIYFCPDKEMSLYYCLEIDPCGRVMDYSGRYYRQMDYEWGFKTLQTSAELTKDGYIVYGSIERQELEKLGIDLTGGFHMGLFRADFHPDMSVNWYSFVSTDAEEADFHKPDVLFPVRIPEPESHYIDIRDSKELHDWFTYSPDRDIVISGHRGGMLDGYPENCIESFEKTLTMMPSFFEIDPRMTKDSVIVLMHDETIDRTTTGKGRVSDYTYKELRQFFLKDRSGNVTPFRIPTLEECIFWSRGKTILNLDIKDVPLEFMSDFINQKGPSNVMYTVHKAHQARMLLDRNPDTMFSCWCMNMNDFNAYESVGVPWTQVMAYVGHFMRREQAELYDNLHNNGVMCMISTAPTHDARLSDENRVLAYELEIGSGCDVIETDYPYLFEGLDLKR